jgi:phosphopantothenoylcysteine decarboxylase/phosphopantothenate--cysteine ligase
VSAGGAGGEVVRPLTIVLGVTGSIAAYKAADLTSKLSQRGHDVHVVLTRSASELVTAATFHPLSGNPVQGELFRAETDGGGARVEHVGLADRADVLCVAPATARTIARLALGLADDFLSTLVLAYTGPVIVAPAMNDNMWAHPAVRRNVETLRGYGYHIIEPEEGELACGRKGAGRLADPARILGKIEELGVS